MSARTIAASIIVCLAALCLNLALPITARAQAWLPQEGEGRVPQARGKATTPVQLASMLR